MRSWWLGLVILVFAAAMWGQAPAAKTAPPYSAHPDAANSQSESSAEENSISKADAARENSAAAEEPDAPASDVNNQAQQGGNPLQRLGRRVKNQMSSGCTDMMVIRKCWDSAQEEPGGGPDAAPPRSDRPATPPRSGEESSSKDTKIDLSPPPGEWSDTPGPGVDTGVGEFHRWNPHRADKNVEVGDFYFKRGNYEAALSRYREALEWQSNHAIATFRLAETLEKLGQFSDARKSYAAYLKILPRGPEADKARQGMDRLKDKVDEPVASGHQLPLASR